MSELDIWFSGKRARPSNEQLLDNLQLIIDAQRAEIYRFEGRLSLNADYFARLSGTKTPGISVNRSADKIFQTFGLSGRILNEHVGDGTVVDIGAGESSLLDAFTLAKTVAVDIHEEYVLHQKRKGHQAILADGACMTGVPDSCANLVVANMSVPFWTANFEEAAKVALEMRRITAYGGYILVGALAQHAYHAHYESTLKFIRRGHDTLPWDSDGDYAQEACASNIFASQMLAGQTQGDLQHGFTEVVGVRRWDSNDRDFRFKNTAEQVANYLIIKKVA